MMNMNDPYSNIPNPWKKKKIIHEQVDPLSNPIRVIRQEGTGTKDFINEESAIEKMIKDAFDKANKKVAAQKEKEGKLSYKEIYIPFIDAMAERMNKNKDKYPEGNYFEEMNIDDILDSLQRHLNKIRYDYKNDPESKEEHVSALGCNAMILYFQLINRK